MEVLIDLRADNSNFDRLVPQTDATFQYDKFNRLRLRNDVTSVAKNAQHTHAHLQNQTVRMQRPTSQFVYSLAVVGSRPLARPSLHCVSQRPPLPSDIQHCHEPCPFH